jgi:hypothetical protein
MKAKIDNKLGALLLFVRNQPLKKSSTAGEILGKKQVGKACVTLFEGWMLGCGRMQKLRLPPRACYIAKSEQQVELTHDKML